MEDGSLRSDRDGFLTGKPTRVDTASYARQLDLLRSINEGISQLNRRFEKGGQIQPSSLPGSQSVSQPRTRAPRSPRATSANSAPSASAQTGTTVSTKPQTTAQAVSTARVKAKATNAVAAQGAPVPSNTTSVAPKRGKNGRFIGKVGAAPSPGSSGGSSGGSDSQDDSGAGSGSPSKSGDGRLSSAIDGLKSSLSGITAGTEHVDPAIAAGKEVKEAVAPLAKPIKSMFGSLFSRGGGSSEEKAQRKVAVPWYRRLWGELRELNKKGGGGGGLMGMLGGIGGLLAKIPGLGLLGGLVKGGGKLLGGGLGVLLKGAGGLLKRLPMIGTIVNAAMNLKTVFDPNATKEEKFHAGGAGIGSIAGAAVGSLLGPLGTMVGGFLGDKLGGMVGDWLATVDWGKVGDTISNAWGSVTSTFSDIGKTMSDAASKTVSFISDTAGKVGTFISDAAKKVGDWISGKIGGAVDATKEVAGKVADATKKAVKTGSDRAATVYSDAKDAAVVQGGRLMGKLNPSYRHKERFDDIAGGSALATYGSYTNDEADKIRDLKNGGYNTSANLKGGMSAATQKKIEAAATANGLDPKMMVSIAAMESGGNSNAISSTGAIGTYQFTGRTASGVGITNRFDEDQNIAGGMQLTKQNAQYLRMRGLPVNQQSLYMMHQLGPSGAEDLLLGAQSGKKISELSPGTRAAIGKNYGAGVTTAQQYLEKNSKALDSRYASVVAPASDGSAPVPVNVRPMVSNVTSPAQASGAAPSMAAKSPAPVQVPPEKLGSSTKGTTGVMQMPVISQDVSERQIAALVTGGIGNAGGM